jgi:HAE1 family hydrophobic/amphiphilic exporter-1
VIALAIRRPVATLMLFGALAAIGVASAFRLPLELLPEVAFPRLEITTLWPGASPEMVEALVTAPIEAAAQGVRAVESVSSTSYPQRSEVMVEFARGTDMEFARLELSERLGALTRELPAATHPPEVAPYVPEAFAAGAEALLVYTLAGPATIGALRETAEERVKTGLLTVDGVAAVEVVGGAEKELQVRLKPDWLQAHGLTPNDVRRALATGLNVSGSGGAIRRGGLDFTLAIDDRARSVRDVEALVLGAGAIRSSGAPAAPAVRLGEVADAVLTNADPRAYYRVDGHPAVSLYLYREPGSNAIAVAGAARRQVGEIEAHLPVGMRLIKDRDGSLRIREELADLGTRAAMAVVVVLAVLWAGFRRLEPTVLAFGTIGASTLITLTFMWVGGLTLNLLTLAALAMGFGFLVDNAIVVLDGIEMENGAGRPRAEAAERGARKVVLPVLASTASNIIVFVPFLYLQGELRAYYVPFAVTAGLVLLVSVAVSFGAIPVLAARSSGGAVRLSGGSPGAWGVPGPTRAQEESLPVRIYGRLLRLTVGHPKTALLLAFACFGVSAYFFWEHVPRGRVWEGWGEETHLSIQVEMPRGAEIERTDALAREIEARLETIAEIERFVTHVQDEFASIRVTFPDSLETTGVPAAVKEQLISWMHGFGGAEVRVYGFGPSFYGEGAAPPSYSLKLLGHNYRELEHLAGDLAGRLKQFARIRDIDPNASGFWYERDREIELVLAPDRLRLAAYGLTVEQLLDRVAATTRGQGKRDVIELAGEEVGLAIELEGANRADVDDLRDLIVTTSEGQPVRVTDVATITPKATLGRIIREDQQYERIVAYEFRGPRKLGDRVRDAVVQATVLPAGYTLESEQSFWEYEEGERGQLALVVALAVVLIYMMTAALFESYREPLVVLAAVPLALIGVFHLYLYTGDTFTREAWIGVVMMSGIVVNNAILVVDRIGAFSRWESTDDPPFPVAEAAVRGTLDRVRPILMTTVTTVLGFLPLVLFAESEEPSLWNALAVATIGGLLASTVFVLTAIPALYVLLDSATTASRRSRARRGRRSHPR